jgi:hypothetical protein
MSTTVLVFIVEAPEGFNIIEVTTGEVITTCATFKNCQRWLKTFQGNLGGFGSYNGAQCRRGWFKSIDGRAYGLSN